MPSLLSDPGRIWSVHTMQDNVGLLVGSMRQRIQRALLTIDLTSAVLTEAAAANVDLIIAYHPPIFSSIKRFTKVPLVQAAASAGCAHDLQLS
jgi:putative NIF3 family GTP cyclohydrolase 1 type 2